MSDESRPDGLRKRAWLTTKLLRRLLRFLAFVKFVDVTVTGREVIPKYGAIIVASNHISMVDAISLWGALRRRAVAVAMAELWTMPVVSWLLRNLGHIPVVRRNADSGRDAVAASESVLNHGGVLLIYPEGRCVSPGDTEPYKPGVAKLSMSTGVPIIPVGAIGTNKVVPLKRDLEGAKKFNRNQKVWIKFGQPIDPADFDTWEQLLAEVRRSIVALVESETV